MDTPCFAQGGRMRIGRLPLLVAILACGFARQLPAAAVSDHRPNILLFLVDDMGTQDTSEPFFYDRQGRPVRTPLNARYRTPNIQRLAAQGLKFIQAYACSVCTPTRVSIMTGMNSARHHVTTWTHADHPQDTGHNSIERLRSPAWRMAGMDETDIPLPRLLRAAGYRTIHCGKAHFGPNGTFGGDPRHIGFDVNIAGHGAGGPGSYLGRHDFSAAWRGGGHRWDVPGLEAYHGKDIFLTEALTREMKKAITAAVAAHRPFFAYMAHYAVHAPFEVDDRFKGHYPDLKGKELAFATMIEGMDRSLGELLDHLEKLGVARNTLVIFFSDNGSDGPLNRPLRGKKGMRYEGGIRVPLIMAWARPDATQPTQQLLPIPAGRVEEDLVVCEDLFPTIAAVAGAAFEHPIDGVDLSPYLQGLPNWHRPPSYLLNFPHGHNHDHYVVCREGPWKLIYNYGPEAWELYNLPADPSERTNLVTAQPEVARKLSARMLQRLHAMKAQFPVLKETGQPVEPNRGKLGGLQAAPEDLR